MLKPRRWTNAQMCEGVDTDNAPLFLQLERPETNQHNHLYGPAGVGTDHAGLASRFRHNGWQRHREMIYKSLRRTRQSKSRVSNFADCGATAYVYRAIDNPDLFRLGGSSCRDRFCVPCAIDRSRCLATNVLNVLGKRPARFITLTLRQTDAFLGDVMDKLYDSFRRLRARSFWKQRVKGGCAFIEVLYSVANDAWNVHLHAIVHGRYIPKHQLSKEWYKVTGDSFIVKVKYVEDNTTVGRYVTKYVSKPFNATFLNRQAYLDTVVHCMVNRRLCITFGDWRGIKLTESPNEHEWISLGTFHDIVSRAVAGDRECLKAIQTICGQDTHAIMNEVHRARPPPTENQPRHDRLAFSWPTIDSRF